MMNRVHKMFHKKNCDGNLMQKGCIWTSCQWCHMWVAHLIALLRAG